MSNRVPDNGWVNSVRYAITTILLIVCCAVCKTQQNYSALRERKKTPRDVLLNRSSRREEAPTSFSRDGVDDLRQSRRHERMNDSKPYGPSRDPQTSVPTRFALR